MTANTPKRRIATQLVTLASIVMLVVSGVAPFVPVGTAAAAGGGGDIVITSGSEWNNGTHNNTTARNGSLTLPFNYTSFEDGTMQGWVNDSDPDATTKVDSADTINGTYSFNVSETSDTAGGIGYAFSPDQYSTNWTLTYRFKDVSTGDEQHKMHVSLWDQDQTNGMETGTFRIGFGNAGSTNDPVLRLMDWNGNVVYSKSISSAYAQKKVLNITISMRGRTLYFEASNGREFQYTFDKGNVSSGYVGAGWHAAQAQTGRGVFDDLRIGPSAGTHTTAWQDTGGSLNDSLRVSAGEGALMNYSIRSTKNGLTNNQLFDFEGGGINAQNDLLNDSTNRGIIAAASGSSSFSEAGAGSLFKYNGTFYYFLRQREASYGGGKAYEVHKNTGSLTDQADWKQMYREDMSDDSSSVEDVTVLTHNGSIHWYISVKDGTSGGASWDIYYFKTQTVSASQTKLNDPASWTLISGSHKDPDVVKTQRDGKTLFVMTANMDGAGKAVVSSRSANFSSYRIEKSNIIQVYRNKYNVDSGHGGGTLMYDAEHDTFIYWGAQRITGSGDIQWYWLTSDNLRNWTAVDRETKMTSWSHDRGTARYFDVYQNSANEYIITMSWDPDKDGVGQSYIWDYRGQSAGMTKTVHHSTTTGPSGGPFEVVVETSPDRASISASETYTVEGTQTLDTSSLPDDQYVRVITKPSGVQGREQIHEYRFGNFEMGKASGTDVVSGVVKDQNGNGVANATVEIYGVDYSKISASGVQTKRERAEELLQQAQNVKPSNWKPDLQLAGSGGFFRQRSSPYVAVHAKGDWGLQSWATGAQLGSPLLRAPANQEVVLSVWDPAEEGGITDDALERDLHGGVVDDTGIVVETVASSGENISRTIFPTSRTRDVSFPGGEHDYALATLPPGFYRVYPEGHPESSYIIVAGDPDEIVTAIQKDLKSNADRLTDQANQTIDWLNQGKFIRVVKKANETGHFTATISDPNVKTVAIQAYKAPSGMNTDPKNLSLQDIRVFYETTDYNGSFVLPSQPVKSDVPASGVTVPVREYSAPQYGDLGKFKNATEWFQNWLQNSTYMETLSALQQQLNQTDRTTLEETYRALKRIAGNNQRIRDRAQDLLGSDKDLLINASDATEAELRTRVNVLEMAASTTRATVAAEQPTTSTGDGTVSLRFPFDTNLKESQIAVLVHWPNGTTQTLSPDSKYVSVNSEVGNDEVVISDFPVGQNDPQSVRFSVRAATADGYAKASKQVSNPAKSGSPPELASISMDTLRPAPEETVGWTIHGAGQTTITNITKLEVYAPDGTLAQSSITGAKSGEFQTSGAGVYSIRATFETADGGTGTATWRVQAADTARKMPAGVRVMDSPFGTYALVGDGLEGGTVDVSNGGATVDVVAQSATNAEGEAQIPQEIHVYTSGTSLPPDATVNVRVVKGSQQEAVSQHIKTVVHLARFDTSKAVLYRNGEPLPRSGEAPTGSVRTTANSVVITTYTDAEGHLKLRSNANAGFGERAWYRAQLLMPNVDVPAVGFVPSTGWVPLDAVVTYSDVLLWVVPEPVTVSGVSASPLTAAVTEVSA